MRTFAWGMMAIAVALVVLAASCGSSKPGTVKVAWESKQGGDLQLPSSQSKSAPVFDTVVYLSNETKDTLRDAKVRFRADSAVNAPIGFHIGTVAPVSSRFEGDDQVWPVGDLAPGAHVSMPLGLWFDLDSSAKQDHPVELSLDLVSPDLTTVVASNTLKVRLAP